MLAPHKSGRPALLAHRGVAQTFSHAWLGMNDCTATRLDPSKNAYLENTIASMAKLPSTWVPTLSNWTLPDHRGDFAVFTIGPWTAALTAGVTREYSMAYLKTLDIGHGYTADGGKTYPFRGKFVGMMPSLDEVVARFPGKRIFLINVKSNDPDEGAKLSDWLLKQSRRTKTGTALWCMAVAKASQCRARAGAGRAGDEQVAVHTLLLPLSGGWAGAAMCPPIAGTPWSWFR